MTRDARLVEQLARDYTQAPLTDRQRAMLEYAAKLTRAPWQITEADVAALRTANFTDAEILDIAQVTAYYGFVNRLADGLGVELEAFWQQMERDAGLEHET